MREPPKLADATITAALRVHYGIAVAALTFLPIGADSASSAFRVGTIDGTAYFLKIRAGGGFSVPSLLVPRYLRDQGVAHIVSPLPTLSRALWVGLDGYALSLYPFIEARTAVDAGLSERHWRELGATLKRIHAGGLPPELERVVPREPFVPSRRGVLADLEAAIAGQAFATPPERELGAFWNARRDEIRAVIDRGDTLGRHLRGRSLPMVLCHADLHTWNVLLDTAHELWLVDWDETVLAPKERDLMFVIGGIGRDLVSSQETAFFLQGYGDTAVDSGALAYYRYAWAVQDMGAYGEQVFFSPDLSEETRRDAVRDRKSVV
jgi:spectinomycin phosphotransferase